MVFENNKWYSINDTPCQYHDELFFWESEDGTKFFHARSLVGKDVDIEPMNM